MSVASLYSTLPMVSGPRLHGYLVQAVQKTDGSVRIVAGRDAILRVFPTSNVREAFPTLTATVNGGSPYTLTIPAGADVPAEMDEDTLRTSAWVKIDAADVQIGMTIQVFGYGTTLTIKPDVVTSAVGIVVIVPIHRTIDATTYTTSTIGTPSVPLTSLIEKRLRLARWILPFREIRYEVRNALTYAETRDTGNFPTVEQQLATNAPPNSFMNSVEQSENPAQGYTKFYAPIIAGYTSGGAPLRSRTFNSGEVPATLDSLALLSGAYNFAHEWGHAIGCDHFEGGQIADAPAYAYARPPYERTPFAGYPERGWDWSASLFNGSAGPVLPARRVCDLMAYIPSDSQLNLTNYQPIGVSSVHWNTALNYIRSQQNLMSLT